MKKLVIIDLWGSIEHQAINQKYIDYIESFRNVCVISTKELLTVKNNESEVIYLEMNNDYGNNIKNRIQYLKNIFKISKILKQKKSQETFILCYDIITFSVFFFLNRKIRIVLFQHQHLKQLNRKLHKLFFSVYMKKVEHIVLENSFKEKMIGLTNIERKKIHVCKHPLFKKQNEKVIKNTLLMKVISISNSYDKSLMEEFLKKIQIKKNLENIFFRVRNKEQKFSTNNIIAENKRYEYSEIQRMYEESNISLILANVENFKMRISGTIFDAISMRCFILATKFEFSLELESKYPNLIQTFDSIDEMLEKINQKKIEKNNQKYDEELKKFNAEYSDKKIISELKKVFY